jgi:hypothetical protein
MIIWKNCFPMLRVSSTNSNENNLGVPLTENSCRLHFWIIYIYNSLILHKFEVWEDYGPWLKMSSLPINKSLLAKTHHTYCYILNGYFFPKTAEMCSCKRIQWTWTTMWPFVGHVCWPPLCDIVPDISNVWTSICLALPMVNSWLYRLCEL